MNQMHHVKSDSVNQVEAQANKTYIKKEDS